MTGGLRADAPLGTATTRTFAGEPTPLDVFLSSTFLDMQRERDILARLVFPRLRAAFSGRHVVLREVDLRWGVTTTMARDGGAVAVCLDAIAAAFPLVIGLVGWRAGWQPPHEAVARYDPVFSNELPVNATMTEIELRYALALARSAAVAPLTVFLRDERLSGEVGKNDNQSAVAKFRKWLAQQPQVRIVDYGSFDAFERAAEATLERLVRERLDATSVDGNARRATLCIERPEALRSIADATMGRRPVFITGEAGYGLTWLVRTWMKTRPGGIYVDGRVTSFEELETVIASWPASAQGSWVVSDHAPSTSSVSPDGPAATLLEQLGSAAGPRYLVLDHYEHSFSTEARADLAWVPTRMPRGTSVVLVSCDKRLRQQAEDLQWRVCAVPGVTAAEAAAYARTYLRAFTKALTDAQAARLAQAPWARDLRTLTLALDELRRFGDWEALDARVTALSVCREGRDMVEQVVKGLETALPAAWRESVRDTIVAMLFSLRGLEEQEIVAVAGGSATGTSPTNDGRLPSHIWSAIRLTLGSTLVTRGALTDIEEGPLAAWAKRMIETDPQRRQRIVSRLQEVMAAASPRRRDTEAPGLAFLAAGESGLEKLLEEPTKALAVLAVGEIFFEGWLTRLPSEARGRVVHSWIAAATRRAISAWEAQDLAIAAARVGETASARALLVDAGGATDTKGACRVEREAMLAMLTRDAEALRRILRSLDDDSDDAAWSTRALVVLKAVAEGTLPLAKAEGDALLRSIEVRRRALGRPLFDGQACILSGQIHLNNGRWRRALDGFRVAQRVGRRFGQARMLCRSLERESAVRLELNQFRAARCAALECRALARSAQEKELEALAFERLIEVERRTAHYSRAYELATEFRERCKSAKIACLDRADRALDSIERA